MGNCDEEVGEGDSKCKGDKDENQRKIEERVSSEGMAGGSKSAGGTPKVDGSKETCGSSLFEGKHNAPSKVEDSLKITSQLCSAQRVTGS